MAENSNVVQFDHNENNFSHRISNGNDLLFRANDSEIVNVANTSNCSFQQFENENSEVKSNTSGASDVDQKFSDYPSDPNLNLSHGDIDLSITEQFGKMTLLSLGNDSFAEKQKINSSFSESKVTSSDNQSGESFSESNRKSSVIQLEKLSFSESKDKSSDNLSGESFSESKDKSLDIQLEKLSFTETKEESSDNQDGVPFTESKDKSDNQSVEPSLHVSQDFLLLETSNLNVSEKISEGNASESILPESVQSPSPQNDAKEITSSPRNVSLQDVFNADGVGVPSPADKGQPLQDTPNCMRLSMPTSPSAGHEAAQNEQSDKNICLNEDETKSPDDSGNGLVERVLSFQEAKDISGEISNSSLLSTSESKVHFGNENVTDHSSLPSESRELLNFDSSQNIKAVDSCLAIPDSSQVYNPTEIMNPGSLDTNLFKVPAVPKENKGFKTVDALEHLVGQSMNEVSNSGSLPTSTIETSLCDGSSESTENQDAVKFDTIPVKSVELKDDYLGFSDAMGFTNLSAMHNIGGMTEDPFKIEPNADHLGSPDSSPFTNLSDLKNPSNVGDDPFKVPKDEEEEFTDAVQFFKDPSSLQFLENIQTSGPSESVIPRSSLYVAFDPLHSRIVHGSQIQGVPTQPRRSDPEMREPVEDKGKPVNKHLVDLSARESMGNILISFDSPMAGGKVQGDRIEDGPSVATKLYTEEELQQALKIHELTLQDSYLKQHRELEQELAKSKEDSRDTIEKLTLLCRTFKVTTEDLVVLLASLSKSKNQLEEENEKLKEEVKTAVEDLQSVESTFSDFHKRYEQCKGMLKTYKDNEVRLKEEIASWKSNVSEQEQKYNMLQERTQEVLEKANAEVASAKKSSEGQVTVLRAQLKKAELKISGLESDIRQIKMENSQLGGICDDLMAKVSEA